MYYVQRYYKGETTSLTGSVTIKNFEVTNRGDESPLFSLGIPLLPFLDEEEVPASLIQALLSVTVGITSEEDAYSLLTVTIAPDSRDTAYRVTQYRSPAIFQYNGRYYRIPTMFLDVYFPKDGPESP
jgi:hypothetical protein